MSIIVFRIFIIKELKVETLIKNNLLIFNKQLFLLICIFTFFFLSLTLLFVFPRDNIVGDMVGHYYKLKFVLVIIHILI